MRSHLKFLASNEGSYPYGLREPPPPWGAVTKDRRFSKQEAETTKLHSGRYRFNAHAVEVQYDVK